MTTHPDLTDAAPAPLDPGNPEHLRQVANMLLRGAVEMNRDSHLAISMYAVDLYLRERADRIEREAAEAEQDRKDRERAAEYVREAMTATPEFGDVAEVAALIAIRAGRSEREEVAK